MQEQRLGGVGEVRLSLLIAYALSLAVGVIRAEKKPPLKGPRKARRAGK